MDVAIRHGPILVDLTTGELGTIVLFMKRVLSLGAGIQSTTLLLMSIKGELPMLDAWVFADTQYEPKAVYEHLEWCKEESAKAGIAFYEVTAGDLRQDALEFRRHLKSSDGKRYASIPLFILNPDGKQGRVKRQCTKEYKVIPVERVIKRKIMLLGHGERAPKEPVVEQWLGISTDEHGRAKAPGVYRNMRKKGRDLFGDESISIGKKWHGIPWKTHVYPLLGLQMNSDRSTKTLDWLKYDMSRQDCIAWLKKAYPDRKVPRSACIGCPFRSNTEWIEMRDERPDEWADAVAFDNDLRRMEAEGKQNGKRAPQVGIPFLHRQLVPLDMADLGGDGEKAGGGCGVLNDEWSIGLCGV